MQLILRPGFSTAERLTQSAGRGIGMDVVASEITKLGGILRIDSEVGAGHALYRAAAIYPGGYAGFDCAHGPGALCPAAAHRRGDYSH